MRPEGSPARAFATDGRRSVLPAYDLAIIGSGPGGYVAAIRASQWGLKTLVIEKDGFLGGTCLHVGCIPTKVLLHHAEIYDTLKHASEFGLEVSDIKVNWTAMLARKERIVNKHAKGIEFLFRKNKVEMMQGWGRWAAPHHVQVENAGKITDVVGALGRAAPCAGRECRKNHGRGSRPYPFCHRLGSALAARRRIRRQSDCRQSRYSEAAASPQNACG